MPPSLALFAVGGGPDTWRAYFRTRELPRRLGYVDVSALGAETPILLREVDPALTSYGADAGDDSAVLVLGSSDGPPMLVRLGSDVDQVFVLDHPRTPSGAAPKLSANEQSVMVVGRALGAAGYSVALLDFITGEATFADLPSDLVAGAVRSTRVVGLWNDGRALLATLSQDDGRLSLGYTWLGPRGGVEASWTAPQTFPVTWDVGIAPVPVGPDGPTLLVFTAGPPSGQHALFAGVALSPGEVVGGLRPVTLLTSQPWQLEAWAHGAQVYVASAAAELTLLSLTCEP